MKRLLSTLRNRNGMTLIEMVVGAGLLCLVIAIFSASLRPAAEVTRRTEELNSAQLIADDLLETVRSKVETATSFVKCYDGGENVLNKSGAAAGTAIEYKNEDGRFVLLTADGCPATKIVAGNSVTQQSEIEKGYLIERYYQANSNNQYYCIDKDGNAIARAMTLSYSKRFYVGLRAGLSFAINEGDHTVTATATIYRGAVDDANKIYSDSLIIDLRYQPPLSTAVTAVQQPDT